MILLYDIGLHWLDFLDFHEMMVHPVHIGRLLWARVARVGISKLAQSFKSSPLRFHISPQHQKSYFPHLLETAFEPKWYMVSPQRDPTSTPQGSRISSHYLLKHVGSSSENCNI